MIDTVLFDLYETLITEAPAEPTRAGSLAAVLGLDRTEYKREWKARRPRVVTGALSFAGALAEICQALGGNVDTPVIERICRQRVEEKSAAFARLDDNVAALIRELSGRRIGLGVVSNGFAEDVQGWASWALASSFPCTAFSCVEGVAKPDPEIYRRALHRLGARPEATVYIGDGGDDELAGAERTGLRAYRAAWFVKGDPALDTRPALAVCEDVLKIVAAG